MLGVDSLKKLKYSFYDNKLKHTSKCTLGNARSHKLYSSIDSLLVTKGENLDDLENYIFIDSYDSWTRNKGRMKLKNIIKNKNQLTTKVVYLRVRKIM